MNLTLELLRFLGSPFEPATISISQNKLVELSQASAKNRMLFFYLDKISGKNLGELTDLYNNEYSSYMRTNDAIARASQILTNANIEHTVFKTIRPYTSTTVDLDILILGKNDNYMKSVKEMQNAGCELIVRGPKSATLFDKEADMGIDLYEQVAVSFITYLDKQTLIAHITTIKLPNGKYVKTLKPEADLACIIAHSVVKEQMYTLSEYYTFVHYLKQMNVNNFLQIVKQNNITTATRTHATITALLHRMAHKTMPNELQQILNSFDEETFETTRLIKKNFETPHKYHPITIARSLFEITKGKETRKSIVAQAYHMFNLRFSSDFLVKLIDHVLRKTY